MIKHGFICAWEQDGDLRSFMTNLTHNGGQETGFELLDSENVQVTFDVFTRRSWTRIFATNEIRFDAKVACKHCPEEKCFSHGRTGFRTGSDEESFSCACGKCNVQLAFIFSRKGLMDLTDQLPIFGVVPRALSAGIKHLKADHEGAREEWQIAGSNLVPVPGGTHLFTKDGAGTKLLEAVPGVNILVACAHAANGHLEHAERAKNLRGSWSNMAGRDGALASLAKLVPGADMVAFGLHCRKGHYAYALAAITNKEYIKVKWQSFEVHLQNPRNLATLTCSAVRWSTTTIEPEQKKLFPALAALIGQRFQLQSDVDENTIAGVVESTVIGLTGNSIGEVVKTQLELVPLRVQAALEQTNQQLTEFRAKSFFFWLLLPASAPAPSSETMLRLIEAVQELVHGATLRHHEEVPDVKCEPITTRPFFAEFFGRGFGVRLGLALILLGMAVPSLLLAALGGAVVLACVPVDYLFQYLDVYNTEVSNEALKAVSQSEMTKSATEATPPAANDSLSGPSPAEDDLQRERLRYLSAVVAILALAIWSFRMSLAVLLLIPLAGSFFWSLPALPAAPPAATPAGVAIEFRPEHVQAVFDALYDYVCHEMLRDEFLGYVVTLLDWLRRAFLTFHEDLPEMPLAFNIPVPAMFMEGMPHQGSAMQTPSFNILGVANVGLAQFGHVRLMLTDSTLQGLLKVGEQWAAKADLRQVAEQLNECPSSVRLKYDLDVEWPSPSHAVIHARNVEVKIPLPQ